MLHYRVQSYRLKSYNIIWRLWEPLEWQTLTMATGPFKAFSLLIFNSVTSSLKYESFMEDFSNSWTFDTFWGSLYKPLLSLYCNLSLTVVWNLTVLCCYLWLFDWLLSLRPCWISYTLKNPGFVSLSLTLNVKYFVSHWRQLCYITKEKYRLTTK